MGTFGDASGIVMVIPAFGQPGKILGLHDGNLQAYFDSDGTLKWAGGKGVADATGIRLVSALSSFDTTRSYGIISNTNDGMIGTFGAWEGATPNTVLYILIGSPESLTTQYNLAETQVWGKSTDSGADHEGLVRLSGGWSSETGWPNMRIGYFRRVVGSGIPNNIVDFENISGVYFNDATLHEIGNASADTDGLNRITADGRYAAIGSGTSAGVLNFGERYIAAGSSYTRAMGERYV